MFPHICPDKSKSFIFSTPAVSHKQINTFNPFITNFTIIPALAFVWAAPMCVSVCKWCQCVLNTLTNSLLSFNSFFVISVVFFRIFWGKIASFTTFACQRLFQGIATCCFFTFYFLTITVIYVDNNLRHINTC